MSLQRSLKTISHKTILQNQLEESLLGNKKAGALRKTHFNQLKDDNKHTRKLLRMYRTHQEH